MDDGNDVKPILEVWVEDSNYLELKNEKDIKTMDVETDVKPTLEEWVEDCNYLESKNEEDAVDSQILKYFETIKMEADVDETLDDEETDQQLEEESNDRRAQTDIAETLGVKQLNELDSRIEESRIKRVRKGYNNSLTYFPATLAKQRDKHFHKNSSCFKAKTSKTKFEKRISNVKELITRRLETKCSDYVWLGEQVIFDMNNIKSQNIRRETAWKIQNLLRQAVLEDSEETLSSSATVSLAGNSFCSPGTSQQQINAVEEGNILSSS